MIGVTQSSIISIYADNADLYSLFHLLVDANVLYFMMEKTNSYANYGFQSKWSNVSLEACWQRRNSWNSFLNLLVNCKFEVFNAEIILETDQLYYHSLMHKINMSEYRFVPILRCCHFINNLVKRDSKEICLS